MKRIICRSCGESFDNKRSLIFHVLKLGCFNEELEWEKSHKELKEILKDDE